jgi:hypothetical protein
VGNLGIMEILYPIRSSFPAGETRGSVEKIFPHVRLETFAVEVNNFLRNSMTGGKICFRHFGTKKRQTLESITKYCRRKSRKYKLTRKYTGITFRVAGECKLVEFSS